MVAHDLQGHRSIPRTPGSGTLPAVALAAAMLMGSVVATAALAIAPGADQAAPVAALFPPWWTAEEAYVAAASTGGAIVRQGALPSLLVVQSAEPGFRGRLRAAGAWVLLDPKAVGGCLR